MTATEYKTRHHELPLIKVGKRVAVAVAETSAWFRRSVKPHLWENIPVRIDAAAGYAYALFADGSAREPVQALRLVLRWHAGQLYLESATGTDGRAIDLRALLTTPTLEELAEQALRHPAQDSALSRSGLHPAVQSQVAETSRQETALRRALLGEVLHGNSAAMCLCVKLLGTSFGGYDPHGDLYKQAAEKLATVAYAPHLRDLLTSLIASPLMTAIRGTAVDFCHHLETAGIESTWTAEQLARA